MFLDALARLLDLESNYKSAVFLRGPLLFGQSEHVTIMLSLDPSTLENGCLEVGQGSGRQRRLPQAADLTLDAQTSPTFNPFIFSLVSIDYFFTIETNIYTTVKHYEKLKIVLRCVTFFINYMQFHDFISYMT